MSRQAAIGKTAGHPGNGTIGRTARADLRPARTRLGPSSGRPGQPGAARERDRDGEVRTLRRAATVPATAVRIAGIAIIVGMAGIAGIAGCSSSGTSSPPPPSPPSSSSSQSHLSWIIQDHFLSLVQANSSALREFSNAQNVYVILSAKEAAAGDVPSMPGVKLTPTVYYNSYARYVSDYNAGQISSAVKAVVFDDSSDTPANVVPPIEAQNPFEYDQKLTEFANRHGMISMCNYILGKRIDSKQGEAPPCDVALLNYSQQSERDPSRYQSVVSTAVNTIRQTRPTMPVLVGLSTNPRGTPITAGILTAAAQATYKDVSGYWISIPTSGGVGCPNCSPQNPAILAPFLAHLYADNVTEHGPD
jgi:hypothetical protein